MYIVHLLCISNDSINKRDCSHFSLSILWQERLINYEFSYLLRKTTVYSQSQSAFIASFDKTTVDKFIVNYRAPPSLQALIIL